MIVFDLKCDNAHVFEAWFGSSNAFEDQCARNLVICPFCHSTAIQKAVMAPAIGVKANSDAATRKAAQGKAAEGEASQGKASEGEASGSDAAKTPDAATPRTDHGNAIPAITQQSGDQSALAQSALAQSLPAQEVAKLKSLMTALAKAQSKALEKSDWVGKDFANHARAMHYGEEKQRPVHGEADAKQAAALIEEGVNISALPFPVTPPKSKN